MKKIAVFAALMPWLLFSFFLLFKDINPDVMFVLGFLWLLVSPLWFAAGCLICYRHGQWSKE